MRYGTVEAMDNEATEESNERQLSEVGRLDPLEADTPISDSQAVAGNPTDESGEPDVGPAGPNAIPDWKNQRKR